MRDDPPRTSWRVAVLPGDGIGPEVMAVATAILNALDDRQTDTGGEHRAPRLDLTELPWPSHAWHREHGAMAPTDSLQILAGFDAILLGALGDPGPLDDPDRYLLSDAESLAPLLEIRKHFDLWACERPCRLLEGAPRLLADERASEVDMLVVRENSEGEYVGQGGRLAAGTDHEIATQISVFTRRGTERIIRHAFESARRRAARRSTQGTPRDFRGEAAEVCVVTKRNALPHWGELWTEVFEAVSTDYPGIATRHELVDAACMKFVTKPWDFDVVVASNLHGDILTDLAAVLGGGLGIAPSCNLAPDDRGRPPMFEPTHGSAPDIAGRNLAGPEAMLLTTALMLDWMGVEDPACADAAERLREAVATELREHAGERRSTDEIAGGVLSRLTD